MDCCQILNPRQFQTKDWYSPLNQKFRSGKRLPSRLDPDVRVVSSGLLVDNGSFDQFRDALAQQKIKLITWGELARGR
jgi:hypothetical protein